MHACIIWPFVFCFQDFHNTNRNCNDKSVPQVVSFLFQNFKKLDRDLLWVLWRISFCWISSIQRAHRWKSENSAQVTNFPRIWVSVVKLKYHRKHNQRKNKFLNGRVAFYVLFFFLHFKGTSVVCHMITMYSPSKLNDEFTLRACDSHLTHVK